MTWFRSPEDASDRLEEVGYLPDPASALTAYLAGELEKPLLVEGPAGVGKTELAKAITAACDAELVRLQCYEGLDESRALYEWDYSRQLLRIQAAQALHEHTAADGADGADGTGGAGGTAPGQGWKELQTDIFAEEFLLTRPLLTAIRREGPTVLLIDEIDKADVEFEALLLEVLSDFAVTVPELGTLTAARRPLVLLTSNATRDLSEALKRRCLHLHIDYPTPEREAAIIAGHVPTIADDLVAEVAAAVARLRGLDLRKAPSISESVDWARTLVALQIGTLDAQTIEATLGVVLKYAADRERAVAELRLRSSAPLLGSRTGRG